MIELEFLWFNRKLSPNENAHWGTISRLRKKQRWDAYIIALAHPKPEVREEYILDITFHPKTNHKQDKDNCIASIKGLLDGVADAWGVDDSQFKPIPSMGEKVDNGKIVIRIKE